MQRNIQELPCIQAFTEGFDFGEVACLHVADQFSVSCQWLSHSKINLINGADFRKNEFYTR
jgi:hypothetical protein